MMFEAFGFTRESPALEKLNSATFGPNKPATSEPSIIHSA